MAPEIVSALEQATAKSKTNIPLEAAVRLLDALELDLEVRPRGSEFTPQPPMKLNELGLSQRTMDVLDAAGIEAITELGSAKAILEMPGFESGQELYEINCALNRHGQSLGRRGRVPNDRNREIFRLRVIAGLTLDELAARFELHRERVRQVLNDYFGLRGTPPSARSRRRERGRKRASDR